MPRLTRRQSIVAAVAVWRHHACAPAPRMHSRRLSPFAITASSPWRIKVPAGKRLAITVINDDPLSEEFNSSALKVEKVIAGKSQGVVHISPLRPGTYDFMGEYHSDTAKGHVVAQ